MVVIAGPELGFYEQRPPDPTNALDLFSDRWISELPGFGYGKTRLLFEDVRLQWFLQAYGSVLGRTVLELGPLEGAHTYMLSRAGAKVTAIEGNVGAFLRCLIVKQLYKLDAEFQLGNFVPFLRDTTQTYDIILASGVLYHMNEPIEVLADLMRSGRTIYMWTHYYDAEILSERTNFDRRPTHATFKGHPIELRRQYYSGAEGTSGFCGGSEPTSHWMTREGLLSVLEAGGFDVTIHNDEPRHQNGPAITLMAERR